MNEFRNSLVENWLDGNGLFDYMAEKVKTVIGNSAGLVAAVVIAVSATQFTLPADTFTVSNASFTSANSGSQSGAPVVESLDSINSRIDLALSSYMDEQEFSPELIAMANVAINRLNSGAKKINT